MKQRNITKIKDLFANLKNNDYIKKHGFTKIALIYDCQKSIANLDITTDGNSLKSEITDDLINELSINFENLLTHYLYLFNSMHLKSIILNASVSSTGIDIKGIKGACRFGITENKSTIDALFKNLNFDANKDIFLKPQMLNLFFKRKRLRAVQLNLVDQEIKEDKGFSRPWLNKLKQIIKIYETSKCKSELSLDIDLQKRQKIEIKGIRCIPETKLKISDSLSYLGSLNRLLDEVNDFSEIYQAMQLKTVSLNQKSTNLYEIETVFRHVNSKLAVNPFDNSYRQMWECCISKLLRQLRRTNLENDFRQKIKFSINYHFDQSDILERIKFNLLGYDLLAKRKNMTNVHSNLLLNKVQKDILSDLEVNYINNFTINGQYSLSKKYCKLKLSEFSFDKEEDSYQKLRIKLVTQQESRSKQDVVNFHFNTYHAKAHYVFKQNQKKIYLQQLKFKEGDNA